MAFRIAFVASLVPGSGKLWVWVSGFGLGLRAQGWASLRCLCWLSFQCTVICMNGGIQLLSAGARLVVPLRYSCGTLLVVFQYSYSSPLLALGSRLGLRPSQGTFSNNDDGNNARLCFLVFFADYPNQLNSRCQISCIKTRGIKVSSIRYGICRS